MATRISAETGITVKTSLLQTGANGSHTPENGARSGGGARTGQIASSHAILAESFVLSIPSPALLTQVDEHSLELYVVTPDGIAVTNVSMRQSSSASKQQQFSERSSPLAHSRRKITCA